jgi:hypothetical protein
MAIGEVVYLHHGRYKNGKYLTRIKNCIAEAQAAGESANKVLQNMLFLDLGHIESLMFIVCEVFGAELGPTFQGINYIDFLKKIQNTILLLYICNSALTLATGLTPDKPKRGRPRLPYQHSTVELMSVWESLTGHPVVVPKGVVEGPKQQPQSPQPSTEFIRLCLKMIDPSMTFSNAMTSIKNALTARSKALALASKHVRARNPILAAILESAGDVPDGRAERDDFVRSLLEESRARFSIK